MSTGLERVLLVDDEEDIRTVARVALEQLGGLELVTCAGGEEAVEAARRTRPQIIVLDVMMPGMDGMETLRVLEREVLGSRVDVPIVFLTARADPEEEKAWREAGVAEVILKPFDPARLADRLRDVYHRELTSGIIERPPALDHLGLEGLDPGPVDLHGEARERVSLRLLARAVETMSLGLTITDRDGRIIYVNPADAHFHGYEVDELLGRSSRVYAAGVDPSLEVAPASSRYPEGLELGDDAEAIDEPWSRERLNSTRDGRVFPVRLVSDRLYDAAGEPIATVTICEDITEQKAIERLKNEFLATVSHELRTPLTSIIASLDLLGDPRLDDAKEHELLAVARRNSHRLLGLINDLLDLQKLQARKMSFRREAVDARPLVEEAAEGMLALAESRGVDLRVEADGPPAATPMSLRGDRQRLLQVLANLLSNAIKFAPEGTEVTLSARRLDDPARIRLAVRDRGAGIPEELQGRIFDQFVQAELPAAAPGDDADGGSGLGLSIARGMVEGMGGTIDFETSGEGTAFWVDLPEA